MSSPLVARQDHLLCTVCFDREPVHPGHGTPVETLILAYQMAMRRHPSGKHGSPHMPSRRNSHRSVAGGKR